MEKQTQLELFKLKQSQDHFKKPSYGHNFFGFIKIYEKTISIVIVFFIISLISFSLGVERGKRFAGFAEPKTDKVLTQQAQTPAKAIPQPVIPAEEKKDISRFTVQVATFKTKKYAKKEAERLEKQGLRAQIIPKGKHVYVCVGSYSEERDAKVALGQLKSTYHDCFIRSL